MAAIKKEEQTAAIKKEEQVAAPNTEEQVLLKLLVNKETNKVLIAEAGKDFVDVLFSFLTLPLGTIARLIEKDSKKGPVSIGCLNKLYQGAIDLDEEYMQTETSKEMILHPKNSSEDYCINLKLNIDDIKPTKYFICCRFDCQCIQQQNVYTSTDKNCVYGKPLSRSTFFTHFGRGFVKEGAAFVITDDLIVMPNSEFTGLSMLQNSGIKNTSSITEMTINLTKEKVLDLLKCALLSKSTLTDLFLKKKPLIQRSSVFSCDAVIKKNIKIILKLVFRKSNGKILFAQGEKDFVDLLLSFLTFPLGGVVRVLGGNCSLGNIDFLYKSIVDLHGNTFLTKEAKKRLVDPHLAPQFNKLSKQILPIQKLRSHYYYYNRFLGLGNSIIQNQFFITDENMNNEYADYVRTDREVNLVSSNPKSPKASDNGYVKAEGHRKYVVTDDLHIATSSPISNLFLINNFKVPLHDVKEKLVTIGINECLSILKASLSSSSALTNGLRHLLTNVKGEK